MTDFIELFKHARYGSYSDTYDKNIRCHVYDPEKIFEEKQIKLYDEWAAREIQEIEEMLVILKDYRQILVNRFSELATSATIPVVRLRRQRDFWKDHKVFYYLEEITRYIDKPDQKNGTSFTDVVINSTKYPGSERREAIKAYNKYTKDHPGITAELDIEKSKWGK